MAKKKNTQSHTKKKNKEKLKFSETESQGFIALSKLKEKHSLLEAIHKTLSASGSVQD